MHVLDLRLDGFRLGRHVFKSRLDTCGVTQLFTKLLKVSYWSLPNVKFSSLMFRGLVVSLPV